MKFNILLENHLLDSEILQRISQNPIFSLRVPFWMKIPNVCPIDKVENNTYYQKCKACPASTLVTHPPRCPGNRANRSHFTLQAAPPTFRAERPFYRDAVNFRDNQPHPGQQMLPFVSSLTLCTFFNSARQLFPMDHCYLHLRNFKCLHQTNKPIAF